MKRPHSAFVSYKMIYIFKNKNWAPTPSNSQNYRGGSMPHKWHRLEFSGSICSLFWSCLGGQRERNDLQARRLSLFLCHPCSEGFLRSQNSHLTMTN